VKRREFITLLSGAAAAWPLVARAQQAAMTIPVVGFLASSSANAPSGPVAAIHLALNQAGYELGHTVRIEYRPMPEAGPALPRTRAGLLWSPEAAIAGWRRELASSPSFVYRGARGSGGPRGKRNGQYRHGERTKAAIAEQRKFSALLKMRSADLA
jgi:hypothetical protein